MATTKDLDFYGMFDFNTGDGDIYKYTADEFALLIKGLCGDGISEGIGQHFYTTNSGLTLTVGDGACFIDGHYGYLNAAATLTLTATASGATRKDRLVLRLDKSNRKISLEIKQGTASALPAITNNATVKEIPVYAITITNGSTVTLQNERVMTYSAMAVQQAINEVKTSLNDKAAAAHNHSASAITSGTLPISRGGTGATTAAGAISTLGITAAAINAADKTHTHNYAGASTAGGAATSATKLATARNITVGNKTNSFDGSANISFSLSDIGAAAASHSHSTITGTLAIANGGTGANNAAAALTNLGIKYATEAPAVINGGIWLKPLN